MDGVDFYNFEDGMFPIADESHSQDANIRDLGTRNQKLQGLTFNNSNKKIKWVEPRRGVLEDVDGSITGTAGAMLATYWEHLVVPGCTYEEDYDSVVCIGKKIRRLLFYEIEPAGRFERHSLFIRRVSGENLLTEDVTDPDTQEVTTVDKWIELKMINTCKRTTPSDPWTAPVVEGYEYRIHWGREPLDWDQMGFGIETFEGNEWVLLSLNFTDVRNRF